MNLIELTPDYEVTEFDCSDISTAYDRIIYDIYDDRVTVLVVQAEEHYNDK